MKIFKHIESINILKNNQKPLLIYHIPKTAGTSFIHYLEKILPESQIISRISNDEELNNQVKRVCSISRKEKDQIKLIFGHRSFDIYNHFNDARLGCVFRNPIQRAISHYYFHNQAIYDGMPMRTGKGFIAAKKRPELAEVGERRFLELLIEFSEEKSGYDGRGSISGNFQAMSLVNRLDFVGITENMKLTVFLLNKIYNFPLGDITIENKQSYIIPDYFPSWFVERCNECFKLDLYLYQLVLKKFDKQYIDVMNNNQDNYNQWYEFNCKSI